MTIQAGAYITMSPAFHEPEILLQYTQPSAFTEVLADGQPRVRIAEDDLLVYMKELNLRTKMAAGTASFNELPGVDIVASMISTPSYMFKARSIYDHHDVTAAGRWGFSAVEAYRLGMRQGFFQQMRDACLHGMQPQNGEGLLNAANATVLNLPPDSYGNDTVLSYDNGEMAFFLSQQVGLIKVRTLQLGMGRRFTVLGPQRTLQPFEYNIVQLVQFQRPGAGSASTKGTFKHILMENGDELIWGYDDTLIGVGPGGADVVLVVMPEVQKPRVMSKFNTNAFAGLLPGNQVCTTQYCDMAAPREIISPMAGGKTDFMMELRSTSGWAPRGQAITKIYMMYN